MAPSPLQPHVMVLPFPAQGHVMPLMELSHRLVDLGFEVDFVHTDFNRDRVLNTMADETGALSDGIHMVSFPDGLDRAGDCADIAKLAKGLRAAMIGGIEEMIRSEGIRWVIADVAMIWVVELAATLGVHVALFSTYSVAVLALRMHVPNMLEDGILDECGNVMRNEMIRLSPMMPPIEAAELPWVTLSGTPEGRRTIIQILSRTNPTILLAEDIICNTFQDIEQGALALVPNALPVGPLEAPATLRSAGHFWPEDPTCLAWLDEQQACSVIYVAFGSFTVFDMAQVQELADGLMLVGRPFLWVIRQNFANGVGEGWLEEFRRRASGKGMIVSWAPQQRVLSHPSVACFVSHCGWNSTMEGLRHGVPFLCWPYFADQCCNQSHICNVWGTGVKLQADEQGVVTKEEIKNKVDQLLDDKEIKARAAKWKNAACTSTAEGGSSHENLLKFMMHGQRRLMPRHYVMKVLQEKGLMSKDKSFLRTAEDSEKLFEKRYLQPHKDVVPDLADAYAAARNGELPKRYMSLNDHPHVMVVPFPAQGHVMPLMELSHRLVDLGFEVDFVHTDFNRDRVLNAMADETGAIPDGIHMVSFPDGMDRDGDRADIAKLGAGLRAAMIGGIEEMIRSEGIRWVIADVSMIWVVELAATLGVHVALFSTFSVAVLALRMHVPNMLEDGILDECGNVMRNEMIRLSPMMPPIEAAELPWVTLSGTPEGRRTIIQILLRSNPTILSAEAIICNTFQDIEQGALALVPNALPVGPLEAPAALRSAGHFWPEDPNCLAWLDEQQACSVIYVAFGSFTIFDMARVQELANGLMLVGRPFLWVIRQNFANGVGEGWLEGFRRRASGKGMIVAWAPQQRVLSHPSIACFVSHCGWNSTMEGLRHGVPFLCWPYFADQCCNQSYICNVWGTGVKLQADEQGVVTKEEIKNKVDQLLDDKEIKARAAKWKNAACTSTAEGGSSHENLLKFMMHGQILLAIDHSKKTAVMATATQLHVMVLPFPAQGHVIPLMELSHRLVDQGFKIDFVNTEFNHNRVLKALAETGTIPDGIQMLSIPDGLGPADNHMDIGKLVQVLPAAMFSPLENMIRSKKIKWVIADVSMSWALELATTVGVRIALFSTYSAAAFALRRSLPKLIEDDFLDETGNVKRHEMVQLTPPIDSSEIPWVSLGSTQERRRYNIQNVIKTNRLMPLAEMVICNTFREIESEALVLLSNALPVGPLVAPTSGSTGHFLPEDLTCLTWLDAQAPNSVIYVAFGSSTIFDVAQFHELANGLALSGKPFLWVVRPNFTNGIQEDWLNAYKDHVKGKGLVISWAPQQKILSHPSIACFMSHCGWNSTMEGLLHGVPFLCWPYFSDQFCNQSYMCNVWKTGIKLCRDKEGVVTQEEIKNKVEQLLGDHKIKERAATLKTTARASIREGGSSHQNFLKFVNLLREQ
uniref:UDP-glycosyltransferases domain-containing protein n=1 Tax=Leersia perrieri TaxID=77586 RepID=A0A0D9VZ73_9ORYZ